MRRRHHSRRSDLLALSPPPRRAPRDAANMREHGRRARLIPRSCAPGGRQPSSRARYKRAATRTPCVRRWRNTWIVGQVRCPCRAPLLELPHRAVEIDGVPGHDRRRDGACRPTRPGAHRAYGRLRLVHRPESGFRLFAMFAPRSSRTCSLEQIREPIKGTERGAGLSRWLPQGPRRCRPECLDVGKHPMARTRCGLSRSAFPTAAKRPSPSAR